jgi:hypothetical protein
MEIKEFVFSGFIDIKYVNDYRTILLKDGDKNIDLVKKFRAIFDLYESEVSVSYYISGTEQSFIEIQEGWLNQLCGAIHADYEESSYSYSSYTYGTDYDTHLSIGGHNLINELEDYDKKYCVLKINVKL